MTNLDLEIIKNYLKSGIKLIPKKDKITVRGSTAIVFNGGEIPIENFAKSNSVAMWCGGSDHFAIDFDLKGLEGEELEFGQNVLSMLSKFLENQLNQDQYYIENTPNGGYHFIFKVKRNLNLDEKLPSGQALKTPAGKNLVEFKGDGKQGLLNIYPSKGYVKNGTFIHDLKIVDYAKIQNIINYFETFKTEKQTNYKQSQKYPQNISEFLLDTIGKEAIIADLGYSKAKNGRYDRNPNSKSPCVVIRENKYIFDHVEGIKGHLGELYYQKNCSGNFEKFISLYPEYLESKQSNRTKTELKNSIKNATNEFVEVIEEKGNFNIFNISLKCGYDENAVPLYIEYTIEARHVFFDLSGVLTLEFKINKCVNFDMKEIKCEDKILFLDAKTYANRTIFEEWQFSNKLMELPELKSICKMLTYDDFIKNFKKVEYFQSLKWQDGKLIYPDNKIYLQDTTDLFQNAGSFQDWINQVWNPVKNDMYVQLATLVVLAGHYAGEAFPNNFGFNLSAPTSTGKSLTLKIALSAIGNSIGGLNITKAKFNDMLNSYNHSTYVIDDLTTATKAGLDGILGVLLRDEYKKMVKPSIGCCTPLKSPNTAHICLMSASEKDVAHYYARQDIFLDGGRTNRFINVPMDKSKRNVSLERLIEASQASETLYGTISRSLTSIVLPSTLKSALSLELDAMRPEIDDCHTHNQRVLQTFCILKSLARCIEDAELIDMPDVQENLSKMFLDTVGCRSFSETQHNAVDGEVMRFLSTCLFSSKFSVKNVRSSILGGTAVQQTLVPNDLCVVRDFELESAEECTFFLLPGKFEILVEKYTSATKGEMYDILKRNDVITCIRTATFKVLGKRTRCYKLNVDNID